MKSIRYATDLAALTEALGGFRDGVPVFGAFFDHALLSLRVGEQRDLPTTRRALQVGVERLGSGEGEEVRNLHDTLVCKTRSNRVDI
jgi:hypothetical protein